MADELNATPYCCMCAYTRRQLGLTPAHTDPPPRVKVGGTYVCPTHDLGGPVEAYPSRVLEALGHC